MRITKWITGEELHSTLKSYNKKWGIYSYVPIYQELPDKDFDMAIDILIKELVDKNYIICGDTHQVLAIPVFDGNKYLELSQRRWGEIMADAANISKRYDKQFTYLDFYLAGYCELQEVLPNEK